MCLQDFFYVCKTHLKDKGFASPIVDEKAEAEKKRKEALDLEIAKIKKEYEEKLKAKKKKKDDKDSKADDGDKAEKERDEKVRGGTPSLWYGSLTCTLVQIKAAEAATPGAAVDEGPRIFALQKFAKPLHTTFAAHTFG
jgi:hypothetical protein